MKTPVVGGDSSCMSIYTKLYSLTVDGVPYSAALFPWLIFDESVAQFSILSNNLKDAKNYYKIVI